jgi:hypothetical protein
VSKTTQATERAKEKVEKEGRTTHVASLEGRIEYCRFVSERIEDVLEVARHFYDERLEILGVKERGEARRGAIGEKRTKEEREEETRTKEGRGEKRDKKREKEKREKILEEGREEEREEKGEKERGEERRKKILDARK